MLATANPSAIRESVEVMTALVEFPPGDAGTRPHRHSLVDPDELNRRRHLRAPRPGRA
jgi:hypothetical protein